MRKRRAIVLLVSVVVIMATPLPGSALGSFVDDDGSVHEASIEAVAAEGITRGCNPPDNDRFCPDEPVTRAQMAGFLVRAREYGGGGGSDLFDDDDGSVFESDIDRLAAAGVTRGCNPPDNDAFCPDQPVTRGQMAAFLVRAFGFPRASSSPFVDDDGSVFEDDIAALARARITIGCNPPSNDRFCPDQPITRAELATFLVRALGLVPLVPRSFDPDWYTTPEPLGLGVRTVVVSPGGSPTLAEALATAMPGDVIELAAGTHLNTAQDLVLRRSGTPSAWIAIRGAAGVRPVVDLDGRGELRISASHVVVENLAVVHGRGNNIHVVPETQSVTQVILRDLVVADSRNGAGAAIEMNRNNAYAASLSSVYIERSDLSDGRAHAIVEGVGVSRVVVRDSHIHGDDLVGAGVVFRGGAEGVVIENNLVRGIRQRPALQLGGNTGFAFFNPAWPDWEGVDHIVRNNLITDFDGSALELRGLRSGGFYHNTIVTTTGSAIFQLSCGNTDTGRQAGNEAIDISNNLVISDAGEPQYAANYCEAEEVRFGPTGWFGVFRNPRSPNETVPAFPLPGDVTGLGDDPVVLNPEPAGLTGREHAIRRFTPVPGSPARGAGEPLSELVQFEIGGAPRSAAAPTLGAIE